MIKCHEISHRREMIFLPRSHRYIIFAKWVSSDEWRFVTRLHQWFVVGGWIGGGESPELLTTWRRRSRSTSCHEGLGKPFAWKKRSKNSRAKIIFWTYSQHWQWSHSDWGFICFKVQTGIRKISSSLDESIWSEINSYLHSNILTYLHRGPPSY